MKIKTYVPDENEYFQMLSGIANPPKRLYVKGNVPKQRWTSVAIVGTRKPTPYGTDVTFKFAYELAKRGLMIISGLAYGVDSIAHTAALEAGGTTLAILANGLDTVYPTRHQQLATQIIEKGGALISEYPEGTPAKPFQFLARNRLISGLADAVIITEAAARSGTLSTATHALEQGKDVFVIPGNITSPMSVGANRLLRQGAHPALSVEDVLTVIRPDLLEAQKKLPLGNTPEETTLITLLNQGIQSGEVLQQTSQLEASIFARTLTMLEIAGIIRPLGNNQWTIT